MISGHPLFERVLFLSSGPEDSKQLVLSGELIDGRENTSGFTQELQGGLWCASVLDSS